jgi:putative ATP-dependent endonuclease of OLD family
MHISKLTVVNYRNFANATLIFNKGINTIIGENGSGKTNLFRAIRLLLDDNMVRSAFKLDESDFHRGLGSWKGHWIIISLEFEEISQEEAIQALFLHGTGVIDGSGVGKATYNLIFRPKKEIRLKLSKIPAGDKFALAALLMGVDISDYETIFTGRSSADFACGSFYKHVVGDFTNAIFSDETEFPEIGAKVPGFLSVTKEVSFTFIQALRDVVSEFHNNRTNPLFSLLKSKSGEIDSHVLAPIITKVKDLNNAIELLGDVQTVRSDISETIKDAAGETYSPTSLSIKSDLPDEAEKLFQSLRLFVGESEPGYEGNISELSLGGANLIFLTLKLLEFKYQKTKQSIANFLLIEEPEAHIHTHIQKTLFDRIAYADTQIIYSTHSTHISEVSKIQNVNILGRSKGTCQAFQPATGLQPTEIGNIQRYLDAVRSNLLFAKSVILVEGDAEEILIPIMVKNLLGISLDELGISLINIRSTGFKNVAILFHETRIRKKCAIVTDLDSAFINTLPLPGEVSTRLEFKRKCLASQVDGARRKVAIEAFASGNVWLSTHYACHTFEVDFIAAGNVDNVTALLDTVYSDQATIALSRSELTSGDKELYGKRVLTMAAQEGKGWFAILLGKTVDWQIALPIYLRDAVLNAHQSFSPETIVNIFSYRLRCNVELATVTPADQASFRAQLILYRTGAIDFASIKAAMITTLPNDQINTFMAGLT